MKTKVKRHLRSVLSIILAISMLISCMMVSLIATDAAKTTKKRLGSVAAFENGATIYFDCSSFTAWEGSRATTKAVFKYYDSGNEVGTTYSTTKVADHVYAVTVPNAYCGYVKFMRYSEDGNTFWTNGAWMDSKGNNNCVHATGYTAHTWTTYVPTNTPAFSLVGNISSDYIVDSPIAESSLNTDAKKWGTHYSEFDVKTGSNGVYSITITTQNDLGNHNSINIGLYMYGVGQYGFKYNGTDYNTVGADLTIPSAGVSSGLYAQKGFGSILLQAGTKYTITIDQTDRTQTGCVGKITITSTPLFELHLGTTSVNSNWAQAKAGNMTENGSVYEYTASLAASTAYAYYVTTSGAAEKRGLYYKSSVSSGTHAAALGTAESVGEYLAKSGSSWGGCQRVFTYTPTVAGYYKFTFDLANMTLKIERADYTVTAHAMVKYFDPTAGGLVSEAVSFNGVTATVNGNSSDEVSVGSSVTLATSSVPSGYTFDGWYTDTTYTPGSKLSTATPTPSANTDYYALFIQDTPSTVNVTLTQNDGGAITVASGATGSGNSWIAYTGATVTFSATPGSGKKVEKWSVNNTQTNKKGNTFTITNISENSNVQARFVDKGECKVTVSVNDDEFGSAEVVYDSNNTTHTFAENDTVTFTVTPAGDSELENLVVATVTATPVAYTKGAESNGTTTYTFSMPDDDVEIRVYFKYYSAMANWWLDGYNDNFTLKNDHNTLRMTEGKYNGKKFAYWYTKSYDDVKIFTIKDAADPSGGGSSGQYFYVEVTSGQDWSNDVDYKFNGDSNWSKATHVRDYTTYGESRKLWKVAVPSGKSSVQFCSHSVTSTTTEVISGEKFTSGAVYVSGKAGSNLSTYTFTPKDASGNEYADVYSGSSGGGSGKVYWYGGDKTDQFNHAKNGADPALGSNVKLYEYNQDKKPYYGHIDSAEFKNLSGAGVYVIVYYPETDYGTVNNVRVDLSSQTKPTVVVSTVFPGGKPTPVPVTIYAKDGTLRDNYQVHSEHATTDIMKIVSPDGTVIYDKTVSPVVVAEGYSAPTSTREGSGSSYYQTIASIPKGSKVTVKTTLVNDKDFLGNAVSDAAESFRGTHYVRGYVCNGVTYELHDYSSSGEYTETITIPTTDPSYTTFEITPVYYMKDTSNCKTFIIQGYDDNVQKTGWGNTLAAYPYYNGVDRFQNAFGGYPGQPLLFYGGTYMIQVPTTNTGEAGGAEIRGLTLSNYFWDTVHRAVDSTLNDHRQTYDYDDFYKIYKEKAPDNIYLRYKYRTTKDNYDDGYGYAANINKSGDAGTSANLSDYSVNGNGIEPYLDALDRQIDIFGNVLTSAQISAAESANKRVLIVSDGYVSTFAGDYATEWTIYQTTDGGATYSKISKSIAPSVLLMNSESSWSKYTDSDNTKQGKLGYYKDIYTALKTVKGIPADITFEREIRNYTAEQANRLDAQWLYSNNTDLITARTKIEYLATGATEYQEDPYTTNSNEGSVTGTKAYFTNVSPKNIKGKTIAEDMVINPEINFTMLAEEATDWEFVGWYMQVGNAQGGITETKVNKEGYLNGASPMVANATYVARFKQTKSNTMQASHVVERTNTYNGNGTPFIKYTIYDANGTIVETNSQYDDSSAWNFKNSSYIKDKYKNYIIKLELKTEADAESEFTEFVYSNDYAGTNFALRSVTTSADNKTATAYAQFTVANVLADMSKFANLQYVSHLSKKETSSYSYVINYNYTSRLWGNQTFKVEGSLTDEDDIAAYTSGSEDDARLKVDFLRIKTPTEKNFREKLVWPYSSATQTVTHSKVGTHTTYTITVNVTATQTVDDLVQANFALPYEATDGVAKQYNGYTLYDMSGTIETISTQFMHMFERGKERGTLFDSNDYNTDDELQAAWNSIKDNLTLVEAPSSIYRLKTQYAEGTEGTGFVFDNMYHAAHHNNILHDGEADHEMTYQSYLNWYHTTYDGLGIFTDEELAAYAYDEYMIDYADEYAWQYWDYYDTQNHIYTFDKTATTTRRYSRIENNTAHVEEVQVRKVVINGIQDISKFDELKFNRWRVESTSKAGSDSQVIMYCYDKKFNLSGYENYIITPEYLEPNGTPTDLSSTGASATISFLENSRNQWNVDNGANDYNVFGEGYTNSSMIKADKLFSDFNLSFNYNNTLLKNNNSVKVGMIIQQLGTLDGFVKANMYTCKPDTNYKNYINTDTETADVDGLKSLVSSNNSVSKINGRNTVKVEIDTSDLDSKNRIEYYYTFNNKKVVFATNSGATHSVTADFSKAYRAYTYIKVGDVVTLCEKPAYFTLYDMAVSGYHE